MKAQTVPDSRGTRPGMTREVAQHHSLNVSYVAG